MSAALQLRAATAIVLEGDALNQAQHRALFDPSPECDSLVERVIALREHGVPSMALRGLLADIRAVIELNAREGGCHRQLAGRLDQLARTFDGGRRMQDALTLRGLVRTLGGRDGPLSKLVAPDQADAAQLVRARETVRQVIASVPPDRLASDRLARELGRRRHRLLMEMVGEGVRR